MTRGVSPPATPSYHDNSSATHLRPRGMIPTVETTRTENSMSKSKNNLDQSKGRPVRIAAWLRATAGYTARKRERCAHIGHHEAEKITDAFECSVEAGYREYLLALRPETRVTEGLNGIYDWIASHFAVPSDAVHSHLAVLLMCIVKSLCEAGYLQPKLPGEPEFEFVRTDQPAPWD
jgi:hypothetical protein